VLPILNEYLLEVLQSGTIPPLPYGTPQQYDKRFFLLFMEEDISLDIKEWMSEVKKPRNLTVQDFMQRLSHPGVQTQKFTGAKLARIIMNACPAGWKEAQVDVNLRHHSLAIQTCILIRNSTLVFLFDWAHLKCLVFFFVFNPNLI
jgi:hypothetical protein